MNDWNAQALVLRVGHFREIDLWLKLLVQGKGLMTAFAFGGSVSKHRFCGCLEVFNTLQCRFRRAKRRDCYTLEEAQLVAGPNQLRQNWSRMGVAANCLRFLETFGTTDEHCEHVFSLLEDLRHTLEVSNPISDLLPLLFRFHLACTTGYAPDLWHCSLCQRPIQDASLFVVNAGQIFCPGCQNQLSLPEQQRFAIVLDHKILSVLRRVAQELPRAWYTHDLTGIQRQIVARTIDGFIQYHLGIIWRKGSFIRI